jgi:stage II sporulation protein D
MKSFVLKFHPRRILVHPLVMTCGVLLATLIALIVLPGRISIVQTHGASRRVSLDANDAELQRAAQMAIGDRDGTIVVMDAQSGRVRAIVNPRLASEETFAPGSTIKPFAALAGLREGVITDKSRLLCRERYKRADFEINCSHPKDQPPFGPTEALAYSCNYFFGELGERMSERVFNRTLAEFGFGRRTGFTKSEAAGNEAAGQLTRGTSRESNALGERSDLRVTPIQLTTAYAALVNGGHLLVPRQASSSGFALQERAAIEITEQHRTILVNGMRGAVEFGTAEKSGLTSVPMKVFGKTGTSTAADDGGRTQGWFIGIAAEGDVRGETKPEAVKLVVLVFLKRAHGADAAEVSKVVFDEFARMGSRGETETGGRDDTEQVAASARLTNLQMPVSVHLVRENETRTISFEDYVLGVVAAEGSIEDEMDSLKALAVASRTFALKNLHRHEGDGYDFCTTTHCQRFIPVDRDAVRSAIRRAVAETEGEVLRDGNNTIVESYFSASCGGMTADIRSLWGSAPKPYLRGTRDDYCNDMPHSHWTDAIPVEKLIEALQSDPRSDVGKRLDRVRILKRDATGRAELMELAGERRLILRGWDFKIIVGRALGWNLLKSSRFDVSRVGQNFIFRGRGFGHGLGLCQEGAHVMASSGIGYQQILARYFPGTTLRKENLSRSTS